MLRMPTAVPDLLATDLQMRDVVLDLLFERGPMTQRDVADALPHVTCDISSVLGRMASDGMLTTSGPGNAPAYTPSEHITPTTRSLASAALRTGRPTLVRLTDVAKPRGGFYCAPSGGFSSIAYGTESCNGR